MKFALTSLFFFALTAQIAVTADDSCQGRRCAPLAYLQFAGMAEALLEVGLIDECTYSTALINFAYPNGSSVTGWEIPAANEDSQYAADFDEAAASVSEAFSTVSEKKCQTVPNKRCCNNQVTPEKCVKDPTKSCHMDPTTGTVCINSHMC